MLSQVARQCSLPISTAACHLYPAVRPNPPMQPTPLAASESAAILRVSICYNDRFDIQDTGTDFRLIRLRRLVGMRF